MADGVLQGRRRSGLARPQYIGNGDLVLCRVRQQYGKDIQGSTRKGSGNEVKGENIGKGRKGKRKSWVMKTREGLARRQKYREINVES